MTYGFFKVEFLRKQPIPDNVGEKLSFANKLVDFGITLQKYQEFYEIENGERFVVNYNYFPSV